MEKLLCQKEGKEAGSGILTNIKSLFVPFRYASLHKERFKNSKLYLGLKIKCKFVTGLITKKCKLKSGRDKMMFTILRQQLHIYSRLNNLMDGQEGPFGVLLNPKLIIPEIILIRLYLSPFVHWKVDYIQNPS